MLTSTTSCDRPHDRQHLPGTPWSIRPAAGSGARAALEIYQAGTIVDVVVAPSLAPRILRGARSAVWAGQPHAVAWGCLPAAGGSLSVAFTRGRIRPRNRAAEVTRVASWFWIALAEGRFDSVTVTHRGTRERRRVRKARSC